MKRFLILLSFSFLPLFVQAQNEIEETASRLSGLWLMESYEKDSLLTTQTLKDGQFTDERYIKGKLIEKEESDTGFALELSFNSDGSGDYQEHFDYKPGSNQHIVVLSTCQPIPDLKEEDGEVYMHLTTMIGPEKVSIQSLTKDRVIFKYENGAVQTFVRITN